MRLCSYNILDGGEGRADPLAEILLAQNADIIAVIEADDPAVLHRLSQRLSMDYIAAPGGDHAAAIFSRWHIGDTVNHAVLRPEGPRSFVTADITSPAGEIWTIAAIHLSPGAYEDDEANREKELAVMLDILAPLRREHRPHVVMGDFNSNAPSQRIEPDLCMPRTQEAWHANGGQIPRRVIEKMLAEGYVDTLAAKRPAFAATAGTFTTRFPGQRVDYIFVHGVERSRIKDAWVEHDRLAQFASDHFPVGCEIEP